MASAIKLVKEKLKGKWYMSCGIYDESDICGLYVTEFDYSGEDGDFKNLPNGDFSVFITGSESGKCFLCVKGFVGTVKCTLGEIAFSEDDNYFTLFCQRSYFIFERKSL